MGNLTYSQAPTPNPTGAPASPSDFSLFGNAIDHLLVLKATSVADRDAKYANVPKSTVVSCAELGVVWQKTTSPPTAAAWRVLAQNADVVNSGVVTPVSGFLVSAQNAKLVTGGVFLYVSITNNTGASITGAAYNSATPGDVTGTPIGFSSYIPAFGWQVHICGPVASGAGYINASSGQIVLTDLYPGGVFRNGDAMQISTFMPLP